MKKIYLFISVLLLCSSTTYAQLRIASNGNVAIGLDSTLTPLSPLSIACEGDVNAKVAVFNSNSTTYRMSTKIGGLLSTNWVIPLIGENTVMGSLINVGVKGTSLSSQSQSYGIAYGVLGQASNATSGYNYGVYGTLGGSNNGAGVVGTTNASINLNIPGKYAGYFYGNVLTTGTVTAASFVTSSDGRLKTNISSLSETEKGTSVLSKVSSLNPVKYKLKQRYIESKSDSSQVSVSFYDEKSQHFQKTHFGLIAQELQEVYPELVYQDDNGYLSVDYVGLIPILIQSMKEMKAEIDALKSSYVSMKSMTSVEGGTIQSSTLTDNLTPILYQNTPNPFSQETEIKYFIPENTKTALICIYNLQGKQLKQISLAERGEEGTQKVSGSEFEAGIYLYGLIIDGKEIDVKRMVLTD